MFPTINREAKWFWVCPKISHRTCVSTVARLDITYNLIGWIACENDLRRRNKKRTWGWWRGHKWLRSGCLTENPLTLLPCLALLPSLAWVPVFLGAFPLYCSAQAHDGGRMKVRQMEGEPHWRDWATVERLRGGRMLKLNREKVEKRSCFYILLFFFPT